MKYNEKTSKYPEITVCIRVDESLHVRQCHRSSPLPLPPWFRQSQCKLTSKGMLQNLQRNIEQESELFGDVLDELRQLKFKKSPVYSANIIRYLLLLQYTSLQTY